MTTLTEVTTWVKKLRTRKTPVRFRPKLIYLVETVGGYRHPSREHYTSGQEAWANPRLWFQNHGDARDYADSRPASDKARVVKLNLCAFEEEICR